MFCHGGIIMNEINEMNTKLARIKKSCHIGAIVSNILCIICIVGCVLSLIASVALFVNRTEFESELSGLQESGRIESVTSRFSYADLGTADSWHSDIPAVQKVIDETPLVFSVSTYAFVAFIATGVAAVLIKLTGSVFKTLENSDSPFDDKVIKKVMIVMIALSAVLLLTSGASFGLLCGLATWVVYTILDYGKTLQNQSDETL